MTIRLYDKDVDMLDFSAVVVHIFNEEARKFYDLERLWRDGKSVDLTGVITDGD